MRHRNLRAGRDSGIRRLSRLTWRATLLSVVTAFGMATLFAKTAQSVVDHFQRGCHSAISRDKGAGTAAVRQRD